MIAPAIVLAVCLVTLFCAWLLLKTVQNICARIDLILDREEQIRTDICDQPQNKKEP